MATQRRRFPDPSPERAAYAAATQRWIAGMRSNPSTLLFAFKSPRPRNTTPLPRSVAAATLLAGLALVLGACSTPLLRPSIEVPGRYASAAGPAATATADLAWWRGYGDPVLSSLIETAARANRDVRIAAQRLRAARAGASISRSWLLPSLGLRADAARGDNGYDGAARLAAPELDSRSAGLEVSWEIDVSGRLRAGAAAATADALAAESQAQGVQLLVLTDVASSYFTLTGALRQLAAVRAISTAQDETLRLVEARLEAGLASPFDVERARSSAESARAAIPPLETLVAMSRHRLAVLTGDQAANAAAIVPWNGEPTLPEVVPGQPAALLQRRPDLLALRAQLDAANWRRRQAAAEWFPRLFMSALFGRENLEVNGGGLGSARFGNAAGLLAMPLLNWGRTAAINEVADAAQHEALLRYEDSIARALEDVENALVALREERQRAAYLASAADAAQSALGRARSLYARGQIDLLPLLDAERARLQVQVGANDSETAVLLASVRLFKALGGGWQAVGETASVPAAPNRSSIAVIENPS